MIDTTGLSTAITLQRSLLRLLVALSSGRQIDRVGCHKGGNIALYQCNIDTEIRAPCFFGIWLVEMLSLASLLQRRHVNICSLDVVAVGCKKLTSSIERSEFSVERFP